MSWLKVSTHRGRQWDIFWPGGVGKWLRRLTAAWHLAPRRLPPPPPDSQCPTHTRSPYSHPKCTEYIHLSTETHTLQNKLIFTHVSGDTVSGTIWFLFYGCCTTVLLESLHIIIIMHFLKSNLNYSTHQKPLWSRVFNIEPDTCIRPQILTAVVGLCSDIKTFFIIT